MNTLSTEINADGFGSDNKKSANQLYKESGSKLPFKVWLTQMQSEGYLNADAGDTPEQIAYDAAHYGTQATTSAPAAEKKKFDIGELTGLLGSGIGLATNIVSSVKANKEAKRQQAPDTYHPPYPVKPIIPPSGVGGVPTMVWVGIGGIVVVIGGYYAYKTFFAAGDGAAPAPAAV